MTATNKPKDAKVREFWIFDDGGLEFDRRVLDRPISANDVHVIEHSAYQSALDKIASIEKMIEKCKEQRNKAFDDRWGGDLKHGHLAWLKEHADEELEQIKQMKAGLK